MPVGLSERTATDRRVITTGTRPAAAPPSVRLGRAWFDTWWPIVVAAAMAVSIVTVAEAFVPPAPAPLDVAGESASTVDDAPADVSIMPPVAVTATPATGAVTATVPRSAAEPLGPSASTVVALAVDGMDLRLAAGTAAIAVGDAAPIELTTTRIGDLVVADAPAPIVEQRDGEAVHVWPDVTEWYRPLESGFEHGYTIEQPVHAGETLTVDVSVAGAEAVGVDGDVMFVRDGEAPLWYRDLLVFDADGTTLPATMSAMGTVIRIEVATAGATYPITIDPTITEDQRVLPSAAGDRIGEVVAADGNTVAVAARLNDDLGVDVGAVHVYVNDLVDGWVFQQTVYPAASTSTDFGWSLDLRGDTLVVGAPGDDANGPDSGAVYVFTRSGGVWSLDDVAYPCAVAVDPCGQSTGGAFGGYRFGEAVALTGNAQVMVVGAPGGGASGEGSAYLYEPWPSAVGPVAAGAWATNDERDLVAGGLLPGDRFGAAVDIDRAGQHIVVGAPRFDNGPVDTGGAWWFGRPGGSLSGVAGLNGGGGGDVTGGDYGSAVAIMQRADGDAIVLVAQPIVTRDGVDTPGSGQNKLVFWRIPNASATPSVPQTFTGIPNELWAFGQSVDTDGSRFAVGRPLIGDASGEVVVLPWDDDTETVDLDLVTVHYFPGAVDPGDRYGSAVAVAGDVVVGGAPFRSSERGGAAISSIATPTVAIELELPAGRRLGSAVDVDGNRMVVSSPFADAGAARAGLVSVYERPDAASAWAPLSTIVSPVPEIDGGFGDAVALRGNLLAIGESDRFGNLAESGRVFVYELAEGIWAQVTGSPFSPGVAGDAFGASLAWIDDANLAVGAPYGNGGGTIGGGALWRINLGTGTATDITPSGGLSPSAGDELGFSIDVTTRPDPGVTGSWLVAGSPGFDLPENIDGGAIYILTLDGSAAVTGTRRFEGFTAGSRTGTAVAASGNRLVYASVGGQGAGDTLTVAGNEWVPDPDGAGTEEAFWGDIPGFSTVHGASIESEPNRYLDIEGATVVVARPGGGGQVAIFRFDGRRLGPSPDDQLVPVGTVVGDRVGFAVALDGQTLVAGAPGVDATGVDAGAVYTVQIEQPATSYVGPEFGDWGDAANWDLGVPAFDQQAIIPLERFVSVNDARVVDDLVVRGEVHINGELDVASTLDIVPLAGDLPPSVDGEILYVQVGGLLRLPPQNLIDGQLIVRDQVIAAGVVDVIGSGLISTVGEIVKQGTGALTIGSALTWTSSAASVLRAEQGVIQFQGPYDAQGTTSIAAGAEVRFASPLGLVASSTIEVGIDGDSSNTANYGRIVLAPGVAGTLNGTLRADFGIVNPSPADSYPIITGCGFQCNDIGGAFTAFETAFGDGVLDLVQVPDTGLELRIVQNKHVSDALGGDGFGYSVAVDGDWAIVGEVTGPADPSGRAVVLQRDPVTGTWSERQELLSGLGVGISVAIDGNYAAVTTAGMNETAVYSRASSAAPFALLNTVPGRGAIAIVDDLLAVGRTELPAPRVDLYQLPALPLVPPVTLAPGVAVPSFGSSLSFADLGGGDGVLVVGAPGAFGNEGRAYVFKRAFNVWEATPEELTSPDVGELNSRFGSAVAVSADTLLVAASFNSDPSGDAGAVFVYDGPDASNVVQKVQAWDGPTAIPVSSDTFGTSMSLDGDLLVVGAPAAQRHGVAARDGAAYVFERSAGQWNETAQLRAPDGFNGERFGGAVFMADGNLLVGAPADNNNNGPAAGAVYSYDVAQPIVPPGLTFDFDVAGATSEVKVAPTGIAVSRFNRSLVESQNTTTVAASSISTIDLGATSLAAVPIGATPLSAIVIDSEQLSSIPLVQIDVEGGWSTIIEGTALEGEPFSTLTFRDVLRDPQVSSTVAALPLSAIDVRGTPLSAIPLSAIALGATPLSAIPLSAIDAGDNQSPWCAIIESLIETDCADALMELSLMEVTLRGVPLSAIPLSAIPLSAIDLQASPLSAIPLSAIELQASPLSAIPLSAIPLSAIGPSATPLSAIPLSAIPLSAIPLSAIPLSAIQVQGAPLSAIPLSAIPLSAIPTSIPLSAIPLSAIEVNGTPLSAIQVQGAPLSAIPLSAILLADTPLSAIPLSAIGGTTDWCAVLAGTGYDCTNGVVLGETTLRELSVRGVPLSAIPLSAIPLSAIDVAGSPLSAIPLSAIPLSAIPLSAIPLSAINVAGTPLSAIPLSAIDVAGSPLSAIPLSAIPLSAIGPTAAPLSAIPLSAIPLSAIPLSAIPLSAIQVQGSPLSAIPLSAIDVLGSPLSAIPLSAIPLSAIPLSAINCSRVDCATATLGDAIRRGAVNLSDIDLGDIQTATSGIRLGDLADAFLSFDRAALRAAVNGSGQFLGNLNGVDDLTLGDLPADLVAGATLGQLLAALSTVTFADLVAALDDPAAGAAIRLAITGRGETLGDLDSLGDVTLGDLMAGGGPAIDLIDLTAIAPILGFITVQSLLTAMNATVGQIPGTVGGLTSDELGQLTLADLVDAAAYQQTELGDLFEQLGLAGLLDGFTLADLLIALIDPASQAFGGFRFEQVDVGALPSGTVAGVGFEADFMLSGSLPRTIEVNVTLPSNADYVRGSSTIDVAETLSPLGDPVISGRVLTWTLLAQPGQNYTIDFEVLPAVRLGATSLAATATVVGTDVVVAGSASVQVVEGLEPNDYPETTPASNDTIYLTYISTPTDIDVFELTLQENDRLLVELSNLDADLDLVLYANYEGTATGASLSQVGDQPVLIPITDPDADGGDTEPLDDFPRLDLLYPLDGLELLQVSNRSGTANETLSTGRLPAGTYYVQVHGVNGAVNVSPASLQFKVIKAESRPECATLGSLPTATPGQAPLLGGLTGNTLFLVNEMRLEQLHGAAGRTAVMDSLDALVAYLEVTPMLGIDPIVVPVDAFANVRAAYDAWDDPTNPEDACDPGSANAVVSAINTTIVDPLRDQLDHVVIVGGDEIIPMARLLDRTTVANEYDFRHEFDGRLAGGAGANAFTASFWSGTFLSDEPYGEAAARSLGDRHLYVTDVALGRLVETPSEIADALDNFVVFGGQLDVSTATVLGYDFLSDGSRKIADALSDALGTGNVDDELAEGFTATNLPWDRFDAADKLAEAATNALVSLNAHFDHYRALPAIGDKVPNFDDNLVATAVRSQLGDGALAQSLVFSMGCHSGLSVSDVLIGSTNADWAQTMGQLGALYVGNTGFGYGDTVRVAYTEELMALFAEEVVRPLDLDGSGTSTTVGQALAYAKNRYIAENSVFSVYDEKAVMESTFYGLPFYRVGLTPVDPSAVPTNVTTPDVTNTPSIRTSVTATNLPVLTERGTYYANVVDGVEQAIVAPGRPIQPKLTTDVSVVDLADTTKLAEFATGAIVLGMQSRWVPLADPVIATPVFDQAAGAPEPEVGDIVFPARPVTINTITEPGGQRQRLALATGQYRSDQAIQRLDDRIDLVVYYRDLDETDASPPVISAVDSSLSGGLLTVQVTATDSASAVDRVYVLVAENPGSTSVVWRGLDLTLQNGRWVGSLALAAGTTDVEFIVQAKDAVGNVGYATNKARNFLTSATPPPPPPPPTALTATVPAPTSASGWFDGPVSVSVTSNAPATYSIDGSQPAPVPTGGSFEITGDGISTWTVTTSTGWSTSGIVRIDTDGAPRVTISSPATDAVYQPAGGVVDVTCQDVSLVGCAITLNGQPVANGAPLPTEPGTYTLSVTAIDSLSQSMTQSSTFTIAVDAAPPVLGAATWPSTPQLVGTEVVVTASFTDETMPADAHTASVDWGDGTISSLFVRRNSSGGELIGRHTYTVNGVYPVVITVTDSTGNTSTTFDDAQEPVPIGYVVVYDPGAGRVSGSGTFWVDSPLYGPRGKGKGTDVHFGYNARYKNSSSTVPDGKMSMHRKNEFRFESTTYDYLVINNSIAVAEGSGQLNRESGYRFRVQGADLGSASFFQVTIWDITTNDVVYDNGVLFDADSTEVLLGGIRIQT